MNDDADLLRLYAKEGSEEAFGSLVRRYVDLVYGAAMRRTGGDSHLSNDVAQQVFTALARNAHRLAPDTILAAWLHTATRNASIKLLISEQRRRARETQALMLEAPHYDGATGPKWEELRPLLDAAIDELPEPDRAPVVFRFFERRAYAEIGAKLMISEDAARMRTDRALERLRTALRRRGIESTATALAIVVSSQPLISAPTGLAATLTSQAIAAATAGTLLATLSFFMTAKIATIAGLSVVIAFVIGIYIGLGRSEPPIEKLQRSRTIASLIDDNRHFQEQVAALNTELAKIKAENAALMVQRNPSTQAKSVQSPPKPKSPTLGMTRFEIQREVLNNLHQIAAARDQFWLAKGRAPESLDKLVGPGPDNYIKALRTVGGEDYSNLSMASESLMIVTTPDGIAVTFDPAGQQTTKLEIPPEVVHLEELRKRVEPAVNKALAAFRAAHNGGNPNSEQALLPYFATPGEGADFVELIEATKPSHAP